MKNRDLKIPNGTIIHCTTEELANKVLMIAHNLGYKWHYGNSYLGCNEYSHYKENTCYNLYTGTFGSLAHYEYIDSTIILAEEFLKLHSDDIELKKLTEKIIEQEKYITELESKLSEKPKKLPMYKGDKDRGTEVIKALEEVGGINKHKLKGLTYHCYYFLDKDKNIDCTGHEVSKWLLEQVFELTELPPKKKIIKFTLSKDNYDRMLCRDSDEWHVRIFCRFHSFFWMDNVGHTWNEVIPFNEETKKLIGTTNQPDVEYEYVEL